MNYYIQISASHFRNVIRKNSEKVEELFPEEKTIIDEAFLHSFIGDSVILDKEVSRIYYNLSNTEL